MDFEQSDDVPTYEEVVADLQVAVRRGRMDRTMAAYVLKSYFPSRSLREAEGQTARPVGDGARADIADSHGPDLGGR